MVTSSWAEKHPEYRAHLAERAANPIPDFAQKLHYLASEGHDAWDLLPSIKNPVLVIHGGADEVNPTANAYLLADRVPGAELLVIEGARHGYFIERRDVATPAVLDFLGRHPLSSGRP
jgi:pimeloyl-ACP methyl ester carboxylesterase